jgi:hypothetical protein
MRYIIRITLGFAALAFLASGGFYAYAAHNTDARDAGTPQGVAAFEGRALLVLSDADMGGTAYADGVLNQVPGVRDALTVMPLPLNPDEPRPATLAVSNSVTSWPDGLAISPDGNRLFVVETRGEVPDSIQQMRSVWTDSPLGRRLTVVDLDEAGSGSIVGSIPTGINPTGVHVRPDGRALAVSLHGERGYDEPPAATADCNSFRWTPTETPARPRLTVFRLTKRTRRPPSRTSAGIRRVGTLPKTSVPKPLASTRSRRTRWPPNGSPFAASASSSNPGVSSRWDGGRGTDDTFSCPT